MAVIFVENKPYTVSDGQNLLQACLGLGFDIPYFCWHPAFGSVGACRQCAVKQFKDENDARGKIVMACMTPAADGVRIAIDDPEVREFRASVIEWMMINHPHDCPVCDEGGECHLQDMTVMTGHVHREYDFPKRTFRNQNLGPLVNHEMNRCIQCYRCVRFYREYAGGRDFAALAAHDHVYFGRAEDGTLENEFSGNLVEVCPTGVFTDKTFKRHYTRPWDLQTAPSICVHCGLGCNTIPGSRYGEVRRIRNRYNGEVNGYFLCDRGRYGYEFVSSEARVSEPLARMDRSAALEPVARDEALRRAAVYLRDRGRVIGIGSPRATLEANFALRQLVGPNRFFLGVSAGDYRTTAAAIEILQAGPARSPSLKEVRAADAALVLGEDLTNTAPMLALALRQLVHPKAAVAAKTFDIPEWNDAAVRELAQDEKETLFLATPAATKLEDVALRSYHAAPDDLARLGFAVAHRIDAASPAVPGLPEDVDRLAQEIAGALVAAKRPVIVSGTGCGSEAMLQAAANVAWALCRRGNPATLSLALPEANSFGLGLLGGGDLHSALEALRGGRADTVVILENDLYRSENSAAVDDALRSAKHVILIDHLQHATAAKADLILPAATFAEETGTLVSSEGRAQRSYQVLLTKAGMQPSWRWLKALNATSDDTPNDDSSGLDALLAEIAAEMTLFRPVLEIAPPSGFRILGQKIPRQSPRNSGRTAIDAKQNVSEPKPPDDPDSPLAFSMEGDEGFPPPALNPRFWSPGWNSVQAVNKFQAEIGGALRGGDPGKRLVEPHAGAKPEFFATVPAAFKLHSGRLLLVPLFHIFGSEPLSAMSGGIAELTPPPYAALSSADAAEQNISENDTVRVETDGAAFELPVKIAESLAKGTAGLPSGLPGMEYIALPIWCAVKKILPTPPLTTPQFGEGVGGGVIDGARP
jgi:NADH-quinone oxidoreductase subunit G